MIVEVSSQGSIELQSYLCPFYVLTRAETSIVFWWTGFFCIMQYQPNRVRRTVHFAEWAATDWALKQSALCKIAIFVKVMFLILLKLYYYLPKPSKSGIGVMFFSCPSKWAPLVLWFWLSTEAIDLCKIDIILAILFFILLKLYHSLL